MEVRPEQPSKAFSPMLVTLLGIVMEVRPEQPEKAERLIAFVPELTMTEVFWGIVPLYGYNTSPRYTTPSGWLVNQGVFLKALLAISVMLIGVTKLMEVRPEQP